MHPATSALVVRPRSWAPTLGDDPTFTPSPQDLALIQNQLGSALPVGQLQDALTAYTGLTQLQQQSVLTLANNAMNGQVPSWATLSPLIAGALALGGIAAPVVAVVAAAIPLAAEVLDALGIGGGSHQCGWEVGGLCFSGNTPYGPGDPLWLTWQDFVSQDASQVFDAYPFWGVTIACELPVIEQVLAQFAPAPKAPPKASGRGLTAGGTLKLTSIIAEASATSYAAAPAPPPPAPPPPTPPSPSPDQNPILNVWLFLWTYYTAWEQNAEQAINHHPSVSDSDLLIQVASSWNASHSSSITYTFQPIASLRGQAAGAMMLSSTSCYVVPGVDLADPSTPTFVGLLLGGQVDSEDKPPLTINIGPAQPIAGTASSSSSSTGLLVAGGLTAAGVAAWLLKVPTSLFGGRR